MKCGQLIEILEKSYPLSYAAPWDNPGLQAGRREKEVDKVYLALDATDRVIEDALIKGADMLLTHHPMLFSPIKKVNTDDFTGRRLIKLIQGDISYYAMHTNYDVAMMAPLSAEMMKLRDPSVLEITCLNEVTGEPEGFGRVGQLPHPMTLQECCEYVKRVFGLENVKLFGDPAAFVERAAISPGSGKSMVEACLAADAQVLVSGDFGHHEGIDSVMQGLAVIDAGHYGLEHIFTEQMRDYLQEQCPNLTVFTEPWSNPFRII